MWTLPVPADDVASTYPLCISKVRDQALKGRLESVEPRIVAQEAIYRIFVPTNRAHSVMPHDHIQYGGVQVTKDELCAVYGRMTQSANDARTVYDRIRGSAPFDKCPLCGERLVTTIDHYLPQRKFPGLAVTPVNLIPCCTDCNKAKDEHIPSGPADAFLHPYFDNVDDVAWLRARVNQNPAALLFFVEPHQHWSATLTARVQEHFRKLHLANLYGSKAAVSLVQNRQLYEQQFQAGGAQFLQEFIESQAQSATAFGLNSWQLAMHLALANSPWFCNGNFRLF